MTMAQNISGLASAMGRELKSRITHEHPGVAKAWVCFGWIRSELVVHAAFNIEAVERVSTGCYRVHFEQGMQDAHYCWHAFARNAGNASSMKFASARVRAEEKSPHYVEVVCTTAGGQLTDTAELSLTVFR